MDKPEYSVDELEEMLAAAKAKRDHVAFPKWIAVHESHVVRTKADDDAPVHVSVPKFPSYHVSRDGTVTVLVNDEDEERIAMERAVEAAEVEQKTAEKQADASKKAARSALMDEIK